MGVTSMRWALVAGVFGAAGAGPALARPVAPELVCRSMPEARVCGAGTPDCTLCHTATPPEFNVFGTSFQSSLSALVANPDADEFETWFPAAWVRAVALDPDQDGFPSDDELRLGSDPSRAESQPEVTTCGGGRCGYDREAAYRRVHLDFCGFSPGFDQFVAFRGLTAVGQTAEIHRVLDGCFDTEFWRGVEGRVWHVGDAKIRPVNDINESAFDYALWTYANTDDRDVRDVLLAQYDVQPAKDDDGRTQYFNMGIDSSPINGRMQASNRAGMLTTVWNLQQTIMFSPVPRTAAAAAYRAYLGLDIARVQGLNPVAGEPADYDDKGVTKPECAFCHSTLDPLSYPFSRYHGLTAEVGSYDPQRLFYFSADNPRLLDTPEAGVLFGRPVRSLREWAEVAANSEAFAQTIARDYWTLVFGVPPGVGDYDEFDGLWRGLMNQDDYRVERMLHRLVDLERYGAR